MQKHIFKVTEIDKKNYEVVFKILAKKKKLGDHPSHPSHPIHPFRQYESGEKAWEPGGVGEKATYRHSSNPLIL